MTEQVREQKQHNQAEKSTAAGVEALLRWHGPHGLPDFTAFSDADFAPAFDQALQQAEAEIDALAADPREPDFDNFLAPFELAGQELDRVCSVFYLLAGAHSNEHILKLEREFAPRLSRFSSKITMDKRLFAKFDRLYHRLDELKADPETRRVVEEARKGFIRSGAALNDADKQKLGKINERLAELGAQFGQNVLEDTNDWALFLTEKDLDGLPEDAIKSMKAAAEEKGKPEAYALTLTRSVIVPFLTFSARRDLREQVLKAFLARGAKGGKTDNGQIMQETLALRAKKAKLLGYPTYAALKLDSSMAKNPANVRDLLLPVWEKARAKAEAERDALRVFARDSGLNGELQTWDWRYYAEKLKAKLYAFDENAVKPYLQLDNILAAAFDVAHKLFGLTFKELKNVPLWCDTARAFEVRDKNGKELGLFIGDYFARSSKQSGAWMSALQSSHKLGGGQKAIIYNICNFARPAKGEPALLSLDDGRTLFHEFGHALHGLLSDVRWPSVSGTSVSRDFVELPSQLYEHWLTTAEVMGKFARHKDTNEPMPREFLDKIHKAKNFTSGYDTVQYTASALMDIELHEAAEVGEVAAFEADELARLKMPEGISMMHRPAHFKHIFDGDGYAAGYYSYMWSEVMDVDAFAAFEETGNVFDRAVADKLYANIYSRGGSADPAALYKAFRGRTPEPAAMIKDRGLDERPLSAA